MNGAKKWIAFILLLLLVYLGWRYFRGCEEESTDTEALRESPALLFDRVWIDSKPDKFTDYVQVFLAITDAPIGIFQKASMYKATSELFEYVRKDSELKLHFPQDDKKKPLRYTIRGCDELPPFDLCLDVKNNPWGGPKRYYSFSDEGAMDELMPGLSHRLRHSLLRAQGN